MYVVCAEEGGSFLVEWFRIFTYLCAGRSARMVHVSGVLAKGGVRERGAVQSGKRRKCAFSHCQHDVPFSVEKWTCRDPLVPTGVCK